MIQNFGGYNLNTPLILRNGNVYGALDWPFHGGVIFELQPPAAPGGVWTPTYFHEFSGGQLPFGTIVLGQDGMLYGTTGNTNAPQSGTAFGIATE